MSCCFLCFIFFFAWCWNCSPLVSYAQPVKKKTSEQTHWNDNLVCVCTHREYLEACQPRIKAVVVISFSRATWKESGEESGISSLFSPTRRRPSSRVTWCFVMGAYRMIQQEVDRPSDWFTFKHKQEYGCSWELHRGMKRSPKFLSSKSKNAFLFNSSSQLPAALCTHYCAYWLGLFEARTLKKKKKKWRRGDFPMSQRDWMWFSRRGGPERIIWLSGRCIVRGVDTAGTRRIPAKRQAQCCWG